MLAVGEEAFHGSPSRFGVAARKGWKLNSPVLAASWWRPLLDQRFARGLKLLQVYLNHRSVVGHIGAEWPLYFDRHVNNLPGPCQFRKCWNNGPVVAITGTEGLDSIETRPDTWSLAHLRGPFNLLAGDALFFQVTLEGADHQQLREVGLRETTHAEFVDSTPETCSLFPNFIDLAQIFTAEPAPSEPAYAAY